jgi:hypothetical protein
MQPSQPHSDNNYPQPSHQPEYMSHLPKQLVPEPMPTIMRPPEEPPSAPNSLWEPLQQASPVESVPVVKVLSIRGVEYAMMTIALWVSASALAWILLDVINGNSSFDFLIVPTSSLIICLPIFALLFIRLKKAEIANPRLRLESSKRRLSQWTQILAFLSIIINAITFVYQVLQQFGSAYSKPSLLKAFASLLVILVIAGGLLFYYWRDEHKALRS